MRQTRLLNENWQFHLGELSLPPKKIAKKSYAFGGFTATLPSEGPDRLPISPGGEHFLRLIAQGDREIGLRNLCETDLYSELDEGWTERTLPHDWKVELPYENNPLNLMSGSKPDGIAYYRKRFDVAQDILDSGDRLYLMFEGVAGIADVWLNGAYLGRNLSSYTPLRFDATEMLYYGDEGTNTLLVRVDTTEGHEGWWYEGAGLYKSVQLERLPHVHLDEASLYIYTKELFTDQALLGIEVNVVNESNQAIKEAPQVSFATQTLHLDTQEIPAFSRSTFTAEVVLPSPQLWSPEQPYLYKAEVSTVTDQVSFHFGVRTFAYDTKGFLLNGEHYELRGVCEHQDFAGVGVALTQDLVNYKVKVMKEMGVNAWRSAHHFASQELLDACDRQGIILMNENRLPEASPWRFEDLRQDVLRSRSHASVAFYSLGNEELVGNTRYGSRTVGKIAQLVKSLNYEALTVSAELLSPQGEVNENYLTNFDILGVNYPEAGVMGDGAEIIHREHPNLPMMSTENASYFSTRGIYKDNAELCQCNNLGSMYSMILPGKRKPGELGVGGTARPELVLDYARSHSYMGGVFLWTAFDYFGEPSPFGWPGIGSQFGIVDSCGFPKDYYYYYQAHWTQAPMVHIASHWNKEGLKLSDQGTIPVRVFSNAASVELFVNGESQGSKSIVDCQAEWEVPYQEGKLLAKAYDQAAQVIATEEIETSDNSVALREQILYEGTDLTLLAVEAVDAEGHFVPTAMNTIQVDSDSVLALGNGNPADTSDFSRRKIQLFSGKALVILESNKGRPEIGMA